MTPKNIKDLNLTSKQENALNSLSVQMIESYNIFYQSTFINSGFCSTCFARRIVDICYKQDILKNYELNIENIKLPSLFLEYLSQSLIFSLISEKNFKEEVIKRIEELEKLNPKKIKNKYKWVFEQVQKSMIFLSKKFLDKIFKIMYNYKIPKKHFYFFIDYFVNIWCLGISNFSCLYNETKNFVLIQLLNSKHKVAIEYSF